MSEVPQAAFEQWAILEILGHHKYAGFLTTQEVVGKAFFRIDVPEVLDSYGNTIDAYSKLFGPDSVYAITPVTEDLARLAAARFQSKPLTIYMPELYPPEPRRAIAAGLDEDDDRDDFNDH